MLEFAYFISHSFFFHSKKRQQSPKLTLAREIAFSIPKGEFDTLVLTFHREQFCNSTL